MNSISATGTQVSWVLYSFSTPSTLSHRFAFTEVSSLCGRMLEQLDPTPLWLEIIRCPLLANQQFVSSVWKQIWLFLVKMMSEIYQGNAEVSSQFSSLSPPPSLSCTHTHIHTTLQISFLFKDQIVNLKTVLCWFSNVYLIDWTFTFKSSMVVREGALWCGGQGWVRELACFKHRDKCQIETMT